MVAPICRVCGNSILVGYSSAHYVDVHSRCEHLLGEIVLIELERLPWIQRAANFAERAGDWPVVVVCAFAVGVVFALWKTGQL